MPTQLLPHVCIIGAGSSGIAACKNFKQAGIPFDCFEASSEVGGMWQFGNPHSSSAYRSLHINTSRETMQFADFPMPSDYPDFPHHQLILEYFKRYTDHFGLRSHIRFNTRVTHVERQTDGTWNVTLQDGTRHTYDVLVVANGHHWDPLWPEPAFAGPFHGVQMHAHDYVDERTPHDFRDKNVLIVGMGNSAMDIACELGKGIAKNVYLSIRTANHIVPKYLFGGHVLDWWSRHPSMPATLGHRIARRVFTRRVSNYLGEKMLALSVGKPERYGLPAPRHGFVESHPTISSDIFYRLGAGDVKPVANLRELCGDRVTLVDGTTLDVDVVIYATGYKISFPFLPESIIKAEHNDIALFQRMIDPRYDNLLFLALVQPLCAMMPIADEQSKWMAQYLTGRYALPPKIEMERVLREAHESTKAGYVTSSRHTIQINCQDYCDDLRDELKRGQKRAKATGERLPVPHRPGGTSAGTINAPGLDPGSFDAT